jgi:hypothetical protein
MPHDPIAQNLSVSPALPNSPIILCDASFLKTLAEVERSIAHLNVTTPETAQQAATFLQRLTGADKVLEESRKKLKEPFLNAGRMIDEAAKAPAARITAAKRSVNGMLVQWQIAERKKAEEADQARKEAEEKAATAKAESSWDMDFSDIPAPVAVAAPAAQPTGIRWVSRLVLSVDDVNKLPLEYVVKSANEKLLRDKFTLGWKEGDAVPEVGGCSFKIDRQAVSKGGKEEF